MQNINQYHKNQYKQNKKITDYIFAIVCFIMWFGLLPLIAYYN